MEILLIVGALAVAAGGAFFVGRSRGKKVEQAAQAESAPDLSEAALELLEDPTPLAPSPVISPPLVKLPGVSVTGLPLGIRLIESGHATYPFALSDYYKVRRNPERQDALYALFQVDRPYLGYVRRIYNERQEVVSWGKASAPVGAMLPPSNSFRANLHGMFFVGVIRSGARPAEAIKVPVEVEPAMICHNRKAISDALWAMKMGKKDAPKAPPAPDLRPGPGGEFEVSFDFTA